MEAGSSDKEFHETNVFKVGFVVVLLLLPVLFWVVSWNMGEFAYDNGLFYMHPDLPKRFAFVIFPLTLIYLWLRRTNLKLSKLFAIFTATVVLATLSMITAMDTAKYERFTKISEEFVVPEGWVEQPSHWNKYGSFSNSWEIQDRKAYLTSEDLKQIAADNNVKSYTIDGDCYIINNYCTLTGDVDGVKVWLSYHHTMQSDEYSSLKVDIVEEQIPQRYKYRAEIDPVW